MLCILAHFKLVSVLEQSPLSVLQGEGPVVECPLENIAVEGNLPVAGEERVLGGGLQLHAGGVEVDALNNNLMKLCSPYKYLRKISILKYPYLDS